MSINLNEFKVETNSDVPMRLAISIVLYHNGSEAEKAIECIVNSSITAKVFLIDNSKTDELKRLAISPAIEYIFNDRNIGYGSGHNVALLRSIKENIKYHIVMNPDITFGATTLSELIKYMDANDEVGSLMPKVLNEDGSLQRLCKLLPSPLDLLRRRFFCDNASFNAHNKRYELNDFSYEQTLETPSLSGCFMLLRTSVLKEVGLFDERYFLYLEDYDLSRRINNKFKTMFFPKVSITHGHGRGSYKKNSLLIIHILSAIKYFNKWGWFRDGERTRLNGEVLKKIADSS